VKLAQTIDWRNFDEQFGISYSAETARPGISTRLMVALHYLKYTHDLSDEAVLRQWVENPYWHYLSGIRFFCHEMPIDPSTMSRWRSRISEAGAEELLKETIQSGLRLQIIKPSQLKRVNVDTTVQEKYIRFPTDARLYDRMRQRLVNAAKNRRV
jgi:IS5 family transposase